MESSNTKSSAESFEKVENEDGTVTYNFKLRDGIKWSDGKEVTAADFEYSWKRLANPETAADYCYMIDMVKGYAEVASGSAEPDTLAVKAVDDKTLGGIDLRLPLFRGDCGIPVYLPGTPGYDRWQ